MAQNRVGVKLLVLFRGEILSQEDKCQHISKEAWQKMIQEHEEIYKHIRNREPEKAGKLMSDHLLDVLNRLKNGEVERTAHA
jgi:DNA-binding FadR family transcriptional regulator